MLTIPGTDIPITDDPSAGYNPNNYPGVIPELPNQAEPGITMEDARAGATPQFDAKSSGGDVSTWDHLMALTTLGGNIYSASRTQPGTVPSTADQTANKSRATPTPANPENGAAADPTVPPTGVNWWMILLGFLILGLAIWLIGRVA